MQSYEKKIQPRHTQWNTTQFIYSNIFYNILNLYYRRCDMRLLLRESKKDFF